MKKEITPIVASIVSSLLAIFIVAYSFATIKDVRTTSMSDIVVYMSVITFLHQLLMRVKVLHTFISDIVCMLANIGFTIIGALGTAICGFFLIKEWMFESIDKQVLIMFIVCLGLLFYSLKLLPEKFKPRAEEN